MLLSRTSVHEGGFQLYMLANKLEGFFVVVVYKARREERDRSMGVVLVFLSCDLRLRRTPSSQPTLPPAKAPVIWIFLFNEGDFKQEGGSAGARRGERCCRQVLPRCLAHFLLRQNSVRRCLTTALLVFSLGVLGEGTLRMPDIYFFECNWVFQLGPTGDSGIRFTHPGNWSFWFFVLSS